MRSSRKPGSRAPDVDGGGDAAESRTTAGFHLTAGLTFGAVLLLFTAAGYWLDTRLHTLPLLTLIGAVVGGAGGFLHLYRSLLGVRRRELHRP